MISQNDFHKRTAERGWRNSTCNTVEWRNEYSFVLLSLGCNNGLFVCLFGLLFFFFGHTCIAFPDFLFRQLENRSFRATWFRTLSTQLCRPSDFSSAS